MILPAIRSQFVPCQPGSNELTIKNLSQMDLKINDLQMFDIGSPKLKFFGHIEHNDQIWPGNLIPHDAVWRISYYAPVFRWLHQTLNLGTIIKPVT